MGKKAVEFIFFGNYFVGTLAVALSIESAFQLQLHFNSVFYYLLLFFGTVMYYTYAYSGILSTTNSVNPRTIWYARHYRFIRYSQPVLLIICITLSLVLLTRYHQNILHLPLKYWLIVAVVSLAAIFYYGLSFLKINLRNTGWLKAFIIGFVWACCVNLLPLVILQIEIGVEVQREKRG